MIEDGRAHLIGLLRLCHLQVKKMDYLLKLLKYRSAGVKEYWIVDPEKNRVIVYNFTGDESVNDYTLQDFVKVGIYEDFVIDFGSMEL